MDAIEVNIMGPSDEAATALRDFLRDLAAAADSRFLAQILSFRRQQQSPPVIVAPPHNCLPRT